MSANVKLFLSRPQCFSHKLIHNEGSNGSHRSNSKSIILLLLDFGGWSLLSIKAHSTNPIPFSPYKV